MKKRIFFLLLILVVIYVYKTSNEYLLIPSDAIRLRIIPNSNQPIDIYIKEKVKSYLEESIYTVTEYTTDINEARNIIKSNIPEIDKNVSYIFSTNDYYLPYNISYGNNYFPDKIYNGKKYDAGYYESLVITIGAGKGDNWWCVLFPNFCLIDKENNEYKSLIKELIMKYSKDKKEE